MVYYKKGDLLQKFSEKEVSITKLKNLFLESSRPYVEAHKQNCLCEICLKWDEVQNEIV